MTSGSESITIGVWKPVKVTLNASPKRRLHDSMKEIGRRSQRAVWIDGGSPGPGGKTAGLTASMPKPYVAVFPLWPRRDFRGAIGIERARRRHGRRRTARKSWLQAAAQPRARVLLELRGRLHVPVADGGHLFALRPGRGDGRAEL